MTNPLDEHKRTMARIYAERKRRRQGMRKYPTQDELITMGEEIAATEYRMNRTQLAKKHGVSTHTIRKALAAYRKSQEEFQSAKVSTHG